MLALVLGGLEGGGVFAVDEQTSDDADQEPGEEQDKVGHRLEKFSQKGCELGLEFSDAFRVRLLGRLDLVGHADEILVGHLGVA